MTPLYSFTDGNDGADPEAALVQANDGNLYGTTYEGGTNGYGMIFRITTNGILTSLYSFTDGHDGADPLAGLVQASNGNLYGTAPGGGTGLTVLDWLQQYDSTAGTEELRGLLGQMLFQREEGTKSTEVLSGGEAARILFCRLMLQKPNVLVLDEPTNHLDLESIVALNIALQKYEGTLFLVTHDHDLLEEVATRIWHFDGETIEDFKGGYEEYQAAQTAQLKQAR